MKRLIFIPVLLLAVCSCRTAPENETPPRNLTVLTIGFDSALRDSAELAEEPGFTIRNVPVGGSILDPRGTLMEQKTYYWIECHRSAETVEADLLRELAKQPRILIMASRPAWENYPQRVRTAIRNGVKNGMVLSVFGPSKAFRDAFRIHGNGKVANTGFGPLPENDRFHAERHPAGRGSILIQPAYLDYRCGYFSPQTISRGEHLYWRERYAQLLRAAAGRTDEKTVRTETILRNGAGERVNAAVEALPSGIYFETRSEYGSGGTLLARTGRAFRRNNPAGFAKVERISKTDLRTGESLAIRLTWKKGTPPGSTLLKLRDTFGRIYFRTAFPGTPERIALPLPEGSLSVLNYADVEYHASGMPAERESVEFTIPANRRSRDFYFLAWNAAAGDSVRHRDAYCRFRELGIDGLTNTSAAESIMRTLAASNLLCIPYTASFHGCLIPDLLSTEIAEKKRGQAERTARLGRVYGVLAHSLGDENYVSAFKEEGRFLDRPDAWEAFRKYLKKQYGSLGKLNTSWGKQYKKWEEIRFRSEREMFHFWRSAAWVDYRGFVTELFLRRQLEIAEAVRKIDPGVFAGWEGGEQYSSYDGYDLAPYVSAFNMSNVYARSFLGRMLPNKIFNGHAVRSFSGKGDLTGLWMNGADYPVGLRLAPWQALFSGMNSIWWWYSNFPEHESGVLRSDGSPGIPFAVTAREMKRIKNGPAAMLRNAEAVPAPVAIYYSAVNFHASSLAAALGHHVNNLGSHQVQWAASAADRMDGLPESFRAMWKGKSATGHYAVAFRAFASLVQDLNLDFRMIDRARIENGSLKDFRILILPYAEALSDREAERIRAFVRDGGSVIADYRTGVRDRHGNLRTGGVLDDLFGIRQKNTKTLERKPEMMQVDSPMGDAQSSFRIPVEFAGSEIELTAGRAFGTSDSGNRGFVVNATGKGTTLFCNFDFYQYDELRRKGEESPVREYWRHFLVRYLRFPFHKVICDASGMPLSAMKVYRFRDGGVYYAGILADRPLHTPEISMKARIPMPEAGHLYDVLNQKYLGYGDTAELMLVRGYPALIACLPEAAASPVLSGATGFHAGESVPLRIDAGSRPQTVRISVAGPDGKRVAHYSAVHYLKNGTGDFFIPTAFSDPPGEWTVRAENLFSGSAAVHVFRLKRPDR